MSLTHTADMMRRQDDDETGRTPRAGWIPDPTTTEFPGAVVDGVPVNRREMDNMHREAVLWHAYEHPYVGMPASIIYITDSSAAVVVKVNPKSIVVAAVATNPDTRRRVNDEREPFPVWAEDGDTTKVVGEPQRFFRRETEYGPRYSNGSVRVQLGRSVTLVDYRA